MSKIQKSSGCSKTHEIKKKYEDFGDSIDWIWKLQGHLAAYLQHFSVTTCSFLTYMNPIKNTGCVSRLEQKQLCNYQNACDTGARISNNIAGID